MMVDDGDNEQRCREIAINQPFMGDNQIHKRSIDKACLRFGFIMALGLSRHINPRRYWPLYMNHELSQQMSTSPS